MITDYILTVTLNLVLISITVTRGDASCRLTVLDADTTPNFITSPGFPTRYERNIFCQWRILAKRDKAIKIRVLQADLDKRKLKSCLNRDHVEVVDGSTNSSLGIFCGHQTPTFISSSPRVIVTFRTRASGEGGRGFKLIYYQGEFPYKTHTTVSLAAGPEAKTFTPPYVEYTDYRYNIMSWRITSRNTNEQLYITTVSSHLYDSSCITDYMEAFDGYDNSSQSLGKWCGDEIVNKYASGNYMYIYLHAKHFSRDVSFLIEYGTRPNEETEVEGSSSSSSVTTIAGISVGVIASVGIVYIAMKIICAHLKDKDDGDETQEETGRQGLFEESELNTSPSFVTTPTAPPVSDLPEVPPPPPSYEEVMRTGK